MALFLVRRLLCCTVSLLEEAPRGPTRPSRNMVPGGHRGSPHPPIFSQFLLRYKVSFDHVFRKCKSLLIKLPMQIDTYPNFWA